jgi:ASC-1-like (ASCH) protein
MSDTKEIKLRIIEAGQKAVEQLIKVAKEDIIKREEGDESALAADRLKNAAATKKIAIFDAFEILARIDAEKENLDMLEKGVSKTDTKQGFAERRVISNR